MKSSSALLLCGALICSGCSVWNPLAGRSPSPEKSDGTSSEARLVGDLAVPFGMYPVEIEAVGLVTGLRGTGCDPEPSPQRAALLAEMRTRGVRNPESLLSSGNTALVLVRGVLRPGIQKGDRFDVEVRTPSRSETTSLRGGWMLETYLKEYAVLGNQIHDGHTLGRAEGPVLVDPAAEKDKDSIMSCRGRVLGGGVALKSRPLLLVLKPEHQSVFNASRIETAINKRFHTFDKGIQTGVAKARTDQQVELNLHPRYKDNIDRYMQIVRSVALRESEVERRDRIENLEKQLLDPIASARAALQLEAMGQQGVEILKNGVRSNDAEVRFHAAEALAYLDQGEAVEPLAETARDAPAFRVFALTALGSMDDFLAAEKLRELLSVPSVETRYGAFRALTIKNAKDPQVTGEELGGQFSYHVLQTAGAPVIHITRSRRPEIVLFGQGQQFQPPFAIDAGNQIIVKSIETGEVTVSKFAVGEMDQKRTVSPRVDEVIRAIVELGGTYPDVVQALQEAKAAGALAGRLEVDALPEAGRTYDRVAEGPKADGLASLAGDAIGDPSSGEVVQTSYEEEVAPNNDESAVKPHPVRSFFARITGRDP